MQFPAWHVQADVKAVLMKYLANPEPQMVHDAGFAENRCPQSAGSDE